eukprot:TRINITY_DN944_c1_g1_i2.p1 TRINITY_DN944_c1_g1~~TRINITY_DN944_c1_g1_i2.p1  ORF type:complete len:642 (-),score=160.14 TRINITY_DN944_c1_g1_i2:514-2418(-)
MLRVRIQSIPSSFLNTLKLSEDQKLLIISEEDVTIIDILCPGELILIKATKPSTPLIELPPSVLHSNFLSHHEDGRGATMGAKVRTAEWSPYFPLKSGWGCMVAVLQTNYHLQVYDSTGKLLFPLHPLLLDIETHGETDQDILHNTCLSWSPPFELADNPATYLATAGRSKFITLFLIQTLQNNHPIYYQISKLEHHTKAYITALSWTTTPQDTMILAAGTSSGSVLLFRVDLVSAEEVRAEVVLWRKICSEDGYFVSGLHFKNLNRLSMCNPEKKSSSIKNYDILCITKGFLLGLVVVPLGVLDEEMEKECDVVGNGQVQFYRIHENVISSIRWRKLTTSHDHELFSSSRDGTIKIWKVSLTDESDFRGVSLKLKGLVPVHDPDNSGIAGCEISPNGLLCIYLYLDSMAKGSDMYSPVQLANLDCHELITTAMTTLTRKETLIQFIDAIILGSKSPVIWSWDIKELLKQRNIWFSSEKILHPLSLAGIQCELLDHIITIYIKNSDKFPLYIVDRACKITNLLIPLIIPAINNYNVYKSRREKNDESVAVTPEDKKKKKKRRKKGSEEESDGTPSKKVKTIPAKDYFLIEQDNEQMQLHMDYIEQYSIQKLQCLRTRSSSLSCTSQKHSKGSST